MRNFIRASVLAGALLLGGSVMHAQISVGISIGHPPPPRVVRVRPVAPGPGYFWVDGYWYPVGGRYRWHQGYWSRPPYEGASWVGPRWEGGRFYDGYWQGNRNRVYHDHHWDRDRNRDYGHRDDHRDDHHDDHDRH